MAQRNYMGGADKTEVRNILICAQMLVWRAACVVRHIFRNKSLIQGQQTWHKHGHSNWFDMPHEDLCHRSIKIAGHLS